MKCSHIFWVFHSIFHAYGHPAILSTHPTTLEITTSHELTHRGDCVVAVKSSSAVRDLPVGLKRVLSNMVRLLQDPTARVTVEISAIDRGRL